MKTIIYTMDNCPNCMKAKILMVNHNIEYDEEQMTEMQAKIIADKYNITVLSVPQIIINDEYIGGFEQLQTKLGS